MSDNAVRPGRSRLFKRAVFVLGVVVAVALLTVALVGPRVGAALAPWLVSNVEVPGRIEIHNVSLSWGGQLSVDRVDLYDPEGTQIASLSAMTTGGLFGLIDGDFESDVVVDGWAAVTMAEDGTTNLERALGIKRKTEAQAVEVVEAEGEASRLPVSRVVLDGMDLAFTAADARTLELSGVDGVVETGAARLAAQLEASLGMAPEAPRAREQVGQGGEHGTVGIDVQLEIADLSGDAEVRIDGLSSEAAAALGAFARNEAVERAAMIAAQGGLQFNAQATLDGGLPTTLKVDGESDTVALNLELVQQDGNIGLVEPGSFRVESRPFLDDDVLGTLLLAGDGVRAVEAGPITASVRAFTLPAAESSFQWNNIAMALELVIGNSELQVPGVDIEPMRLRLSDSRFTIEAPGDGKFGVQGALQAALNDEVPGDLQLQGQAVIDRVFSLGEGSLGPGKLASAVPSVSIAIDRMPTLALEPLLGVVRRSGFEPVESLGPLISARVQWSAEEAEAADVSMSLDSDRVIAAFAARWDEEGLELASPGSVQLRRAGSLLNPWLPENWQAPARGDASLRIDQLRVAGSGFTLQPESVEASLALEASELAILGPGQQAFELGNLIIEAEVLEDSSVLKIRSTQSVGGQATTVRADLQADGARELLASRSVPSLVGTLVVEAPSDVLEAFEIDAAGRPLQAWVTDAVGPEVQLQLELGEPAEGSALMAGITLGGEHATLEIESAKLESSRVVLGDATLTAIPTAALWDAVSPLVGAEGSQLASDSAVVVRAGSSSFSFSEDTPWRTGFQDTSLEFSIQDDLRIGDVPLGTIDGSDVPQRTDLVVSGLSGRLNSVGMALSGTKGVTGDLAAKVTAPGLGPVAEIRGRVSSSERGLLDGELVVEQLDAGLVVGLAGLGDRVTQATAGSLGKGGTITARASAAGGVRGRPWSLRDASIDFQTPRLRTAAPLAAEFLADRIALTEPITLEWKPNPRWLREAIGARVTSQGPIEIALERLELGNPLSGGVALLDPEAVFLDAAVRGRGVAISIPDRPVIDLTTIEARARRTGLSTYAITADASPKAGGSLALNSLLQKPAGETGRLSLATAVLRGTLKGDDIPVSLVDAMSNTDGLLSDSLGPVVDLDAEIANGRFLPRQAPSADVRFSIRGPRADASGYGRLENRVISMPESQTILTVREVGPEVAARFSQLIPELLIVEKRPEDGPAVVRTEGLAIPTNGDWAKGQGRATIALGKARFKTTALLGGVLQAAGQRAEGQVGRRIAPFEVRMTNGLVEYPPFTLPLGDFSIESEGEVDLVKQTMDVVVWLPTGALSDEASGSFNTGLGSAMGRTFPGFGSATTVPWRVTGPLASPTIRPAPRLLIERRGDELLGPLLRPGQTLQDILGLPKREGSKSGGG